MKPALTDWKPVGNQYSYLYCNTAATVPFDNYSQLSLLEPRVNTPPVTTINSQETQINE